MVQNGGGDYVFTNKKGEKVTAYNYPTPAHEFELVTQGMMNEFIKSLGPDISNGRYTNKRRDNLKWH